VWERINEGATTVFRASQRREAEGKPSDTRQGTSAWADERSSGAGRWLGVHAEMVTTCELARVRSSGVAERRNAVHAARAPAQCTGT
jgi:hypothetical protein